MYILYVVKYHSIRVIYKKITYLTLTMLLIEKEKYDVLILIRNICHVRFQI